MEANDTRAEINAAKTINRASIFQHRQWSYLVRDPLWIALESRGSEYVAGKCHQQSGRQMPQDARDLPDLTTALTRKARARKARKVREEVDQQVERFGQLRRLRW